MRSINSHARRELELTPILQSALAAFQQYGYHGTTVRTIAAGAGITMPTLYYHYGNKEGALVALLDTAMDELQGLIRELVDEDDAPLARFTGFVVAVALHVTLRRDLAMLHAEHRFLGPDARARYISRRAEVDHSLEEIIREGAEEQVFAVVDPKFAARAVLGLLTGILDWYRPSGPLQPEVIAEQYASLAVSMLRAVPAD